MHYTYNGKSVNGYKNWPRSDVWGVHLKAFRYVDQKLIDEKIVSC